jgi:hypothetical protein
VRSTRLLLLLAAALIGLLAIGGVALWLVLPTLIEREVLRRARDQGVELKFGELDFGWEWAQLKQVQARLIGVEGLTLGIDRLDADLDRAVLTRLDFTGLKVEASGSLPTLALALGAWSKRFPSAYSLPLSARKVSVAWRPEPGQPAWLELTGGTIAKTPAGTIVAADHALVAGVDVGRVGATWVPTATSIALGLGETDLSRAPVRVAVDFSLPKPRLSFELAQTTLERLAGPFAVALPVRGVSVSATVGLEFASPSAMQPERGAMKAVLHGFIPPHPAELDGFVFGDTTTLASSLVFSPEGKSVTFPDASITAGKFVLTGPGSLTRSTDEVRLTLDLRGSLPCDALASAAAESRVGRLLGRPQGTRAGSAARQVIGGSVAVRVQVDGSTKNIAAASLKRSIGIGCGLKPLTLADLVRIGETLMPSDLSELAEDIQKLTPKRPDGTPLIPSGSITLPPLPTNLTFPSNFLPFPALPSARTSPSARTKSTAP